MISGQVDHYKLNNSCKRKTNMGLLGNIFYTTGKASATRPWTSIFIGLVITMIGSVGFLNFQSTVSIHPTIFYTLLT